MCSALLPYHVEEDFEKRKKKPHMGEGLHGMPHLQGHEAIRGNEMVKHGFTFRIASLI
jgi:hypothetical protein